MKSFFRTNIRIKLILSLFSVVLITGVASIVFTISLINKNILGKAYDDVSIQLNTANHIYNEKINVIQLFISHLASLDYFQDAIYYRNNDLLKRKLIEIKDELDIDIINITDETGRIIFRTNNPANIGDDVSNDEFVKYIFNYNRSCYGTDLISRDQLEKENNELLEKTHIKVINTPKARKKDKIYEDNGLVLKAAAPVYRNNKLIAVIYGAKLLNNNFEIVDRIKNLVFKDETLAGVDVGTATIFLDDLRISTNVMNGDGTRAVGTQVSEEVYTKVFEHGETWIDKAFVVNNWYISGYSPIFNIEKKVIGILYVGILEEKYNLIKRDTNYFLIIIIIINAAVAVLLSIYLTKTIIVPINSLVNASNEIAKGNFQNKLDVHSNDEMGYLCDTFNKMIDAIVERDNKLKENTQLQIIRSEKLASLGRLASGMAHEINNPLTGVLSYSTELYDELKDSKYGEDLKVIIDETKRCREIVKNILDFARETKLEKKTANLNVIISDALSILERHVNFHNIDIVKDLSENLPEISIDINQMKSVINNLVVNAADAMHDGGRLSVKTDYNADKAEVIFEVTDTGTGISEEVLSKIFDPFFTTKDAGKGTGLGLTVTYGIIERHNGWIDVKSKVGEGSSFIIGLPVK
jgi:two-component system, NtrC family, sensor kinase